MGYDIKNLVYCAGGPEHIKKLIEEEAYTRKDIFAVLGIQSTSGVMYQKIVELCQATIPFPKVTNPDSRKWMIRWTKNGTKYWTDDYLVEAILDKLERPILNIAGKAKRYNISVWGHPDANKDSFQIRAHQIVWEIVNEQFLPQGYEVEAIDGNFLNLDITNLKLRKVTDRLSFYSSGNKNHFYTGAPKSYNYTRGWDRLSANYREKIAKCEMCASTAKESLVVHHIISYWLFSDTDSRVHEETNLLCLCRSCHAKLHQNSTLVVPHISEMKYKNLLELLETLKSQVSDSNREIYCDVEKQLGLTDNQQPST